MRLFVAVWPPPAARRALAALPRPARAGVRWTTPEQWHATLRFLGEVADPDPVADALRAGDLAPATAVMGPAVQRMGRRVAVVPVAGLDDLAAAVVAATVDAGGSPPVRRFFGHVTIARAEHGRFGSTLGAPVAASWPVRDVHLVRSHLHPDGARYETLATVAVGRGRTSPAR